MKHDVMVGLSGWTTQRMNVQEKLSWNRDAPSRLGKKSDAIETYSCNFLDIVIDCEVLLLGEGIYRLRLH